jgi:hypothetical protein
MTSNDLLTLDSVQGHKIFREGEYFTVSLPWFAYFLFIAEPQSIRFHQTSCLRR